MKPVVIFGGRDATVRDIWNISRSSATAELESGPAFSEHVGRSAAVIEDIIARNGEIYGVTTGYGDSCTTTIPADLVRELPLHLTRFHGIGMGRFLTPEETRAVIAVRLSTLVRGWSGVSMDLLQMLRDMLRFDILPMIPAEGSVGASGDLTPLSYIAGALAGERRVRFRGEEVMSRVAFQRVGLAPIVLKPKEALAVMNGTSVMTGLAVIAFERAQFLSALSTRLTSLTCLSLMGNPAHFDDRLFIAKPHPGQRRVATRIRDDLGAFAARHKDQRIQDRYSIRCAPHIIGVFEDMSGAFRTVLETEINSANDNPLIDPETGDILHGGNFYGGHVAFVMDGVKTLVANLADLMDRQMAQLVDVRYNQGLPANLSGSTGPRATINHGLKALQISMSAWTAEALKLTMPASVFSRSTECHNQDKVSMGTIAARDCLRVAELTTQVAAGLMIAVTQAMRLRQRQGDICDADMSEPLRTFIATAGSAIPFIEEDAPLDMVAHQLCAQIDAGAWSLYNEADPPR
ncbi:aromatic amino acid ammonia-lyase [Emcibacter sp. SYSU 3D8]|uniref:HAL/PAL/TAL family ammonia-lyase n=1 Tax=Emcibacter sp. SYSU 3D8 TaxID=3133969 RepID=UPI0031FF1CF0